MNNVVKQLGIMNNYNIVISSIISCLSTLSPVMSGMSVFSLNTDLVKTGLENNTQQCIQPTNLEEFPRPPNLTLCIRYKVDVEVSSYGNSPNPILLEMGYRFDSGNC